MEGSFPSGMQASGPQCSPRPKKRAVLLLVRHGESLCPVCHAERSETSPRQSETLRFLQGDHQMKTFAHMYRLS
jgi:hypothetical protein